KRSGMLSALSHPWSCVRASEGGIVGGRVAKPHSRPYMASLQFQGHHSCGGILIRDDYVLTSAHCKNDVQPMTVVLGAHDISKKEKTQQRFKVQKYNQHPDYEGEQENDIMLIKVRTKLVCGPWFNPFCRVSK
uniref:trypsin n=1 Tax=Oryzias sinensis TaxID=183150 RepID=A0A8C7XRS1_9TELE